jgi:hypothetical protein
VLLLVLVLVFVLVSRFAQVESSSPAYIAIEETLNRYLEIDAEARYILDDGSYQEVVVNDLRGGWAGSHASQHWRYLEALYAQEQGAGLRSAPGLLNYKRAYCAFHRLARDILQEVIASGAYVVRTPTPATPTPTLLETMLIPQQNPELVYEPSWYPALQEVATRLGMGVNHWSLVRVKIEPEPFEIKRVIRMFGTAKVRVDFPCVEYEYTFIKRNERWYVVGEKEIRDLCPGHG